MRVVFVIIGIASVIGWLYVVFVSDLFVVHAIEVNGLHTTIDEVDVKREVYAILDARSVWRPWSPRHVWFIHSSALGEELKNHLFASSVTVDKSYFGILRLSIEERTNKFILHTKNQFVWVDLQGAVTNLLSDAEQKSAQTLLMGQRTMNPIEPPIIHYDVDEAVTTGYSVGTSEQVKAWITAASEIVKEGLVYREIGLETPTSTTARVISVQGFPVLIDTSVSLKPQIRAYRAFYDAKPKGLNVTEYVDVRVPGRIYVK